MMDVANPMKLSVGGIGRDLEVISHRIRSDPNGRRRLVHVWSDGTLLFVEQDDRGAALAGRRPSSASGIVRDE